MGYPDLNDEQKQKIISELEKKNKNIIRQTQETINNGGIDRLLKNLTPTQNAMLSRLMSNPDAANALLKSFTEGKKDG